MWFCCICTGKYTRWHGGSTRTSKSNQLVSLTVPPGVPSAAALLLLLRLLLALLLLSLPIFPCFTVVLRPLSLMLLLLVLLLLWPLLVILLLSWLTRSELTAMVYACGVWPKRLSETTVPIATIRRTCLLHDVQRDLGTHHTRPIPVW